MNFSKQPRVIIVIETLLLVLGIGVIDWLTGYEISLFVFYSLPILLAVWFVNRAFGIFLCIICAVVWYLADLGAGHPYILAWAPLWNTGVRFAFFLFAAFAGSALKFQLEESRIRVKTLSGLLPICNSCKKIQDADGYWTEIETYLDEHSAADMTRKLCSDCAKKMYAAKWPANSHAEPPAVRGTSG
jgi:hypothetical protein